MGCHRRLYLCGTGAHSSDNIQFYIKKYPWGNNPSCVPFSPLLPSCHFSPFIAISSVSRHHSSSRLALSLPATQLYTWDLLECPRFIILPHHSIIYSLSHMDLLIDFCIWEAFFFLSMERCLELLTQLQMWLHRYIDLISVVSCALWAIYAVFSRLSVQIMMERWIIWSRFAYFARVMWSATLLQGSWILLFFSRRHFLHIIYWRFASYNSWHSVTKRNSFHWQQLSNILLFIF